jgi:two-component system, OmpR family, sensor kinase
MAWVVFAAANLIAILIVPEFETVPFHFIWISFTLIYGLRIWGLSKTFAALAAVCVTTGIAMGWVVTRGPQGADELTEVPLMAAVFLAMVWHAERRQAALEEVRRSAERERAFLRDASHQLKTPLAIARGYADLVREASTADVRADLDGLVGELDRLKRVADGLILLASPGQQRVLPTDWVELEELVNGVAARWSRTVNRTWCVDARAELDILVDRKRLDDAFDAILDNAVKATKDGDTIAIVARADESVALIEVSDRGCGIAHDSMPRIFDRFWSRWPESTGSRGTGLGLVIARAIVEAHGGTIAVTSEPGLGTTVSVRLPALEQARATNGSREALSEITFA